MPRKGFAVLSVSAQEDNIGDIIIREKLFSLIASADIDVVGYCGISSQSYMEAFSGYKKCQWFSSMLLLQLAIFLKLISGKRLHFFMAPGPSRFNSKPGAILKSLINLFNMGLARISGGTVHIVGRAYRGQGLTRWIELAAMKLADSVSVRDALSSQNSGSIPQVLPDLAFLEKAETGGRRQYIAISVREENDLQDMDFDAIISLIREIGLTPVFLTQVKRDNMWMRRMASRYGVDMVEWLDASHQEQRQRVESVYRSSVAVVSNRLHGLIFGAVSGAIPIPVVSEGNTKLVPTLAVVFPEIRGFSASQLKSLGRDELSEVLASWDGDVLGAALVAANDALNKRFDLIRALIIDK